MIGGTYISMVLGIRTNTRSAVLKSVLFNCNEKVVSGIKA